MKYLCAEQFLALFTKTVQIKFRDCKLCSVSVKKTLGSLKSWSVVWGKGQALITLLFKGKLFFYKYVTLFCVHTFRSSNVKKIFNSQHLV